MQVHRKRLSVGMWRICLQRGPNGYDSECNVHVDENVCCCVEKHDEIFNGRASVHARRVHNHAFVRSFASARLLRMNFWTVGNYPTALSSGCFRNS